MGSMKRFLKIILVFIIFISVKLHGQNDTCSIKIPNDTIIYSNTPIQYQLNSTPQANLYYWSPSYNLSDTNSANPIATITTTQTYILKAGFINGPNLVYNGDFELGNTGFVTQYNLGTKPLQEGEYGITNYGPNYHNNFSPCIHSGNFFAGNASLSSNTKVFQSTPIVVTPNTDYYFSADVTKIDFNTNSPVQHCPVFKFMINGVQQGNTVTTANNPCIWTVFGYVWNSGNNTSATVSVEDINTGQWGNDFALDNICLKVICYAYDTITISVKPKQSIDSCSIKIPNDTIIFSTTPIQYQLSTDQVATYYRWKPSLGLSDTTIRNPIATVSGTSQYILEAMFEIDSNLVYNGDFELGNIGFITDYTIDSYPAFDYGNYNIVTDASILNSGFTPCNNSGKYMAADGAIIPNKVFYQKSVNVEPNTDYVFSVDCLNICATSTPSQLPLLGFSINSQQIGNNLTLNYNNCNWYKFKEFWNSGNQTSVTISMIDINTIPGGNDFAIDNVSFKKLCKAYDTINIEVVDYVFDTLEFTICENELPFSYGDNSYSAGGFYFYNTGDYSTSKFIRIDVLPAFNININAEICEGEIYSQNDFYCSNAGTYTQYLKSINGCDSIVNLVLKVNSIYYDTIIDKICPGGIYSKNGFNVNQRGVYTLELKQNSGCDSIITLILNEYVVPIMENFILEDEIVAGDYPIVLDATCEGCTRYLWNTRDTTPILNVYYEGYYSVEAYYECGVIKNNINIIFPIIEIYLPNTFTPSQESNTSFGIHAYNKDKIEILSFIIFNRWGTKVFESTNINEVWDGKYKGKDCNSDTYIWQLLYKTKYSGNRIKEKVGEVNLIR